MSTTSLVAAQDPQWDQVENIKEAAKRLAQMQRTQGATKAFEFIEACYRTHSLSTNYTKAFEACIAQDYLETQILALIYSRMSPDALKRMGAPTPEMLARVDGPARRCGLRQVQDVQATRSRRSRRTSTSTASPLFFQVVVPRSQARLFPRSGPPIPGAENSPGPTPEKK